jgi:hypothetical protein
MAPPAKARAAAAAALMVAGMIACCSFSPISMRVDWCIDTWYTYRGCVGEELVVKMWCVCVRTREKNVA